MVLKIGTSPLKNLVIGAVVGFVANFVFKKAAMFAGQTVDVPGFGAVAYDSLIFGGASAVMALYAVVSKKTGLLMFAVGFFLGSFVISGIL